jgi:hypothetical protein
MKRTNSKAKNELKLERRLSLVRTTIRELRPNQLGQANGGSNQTQNTPTTCLVVYSLV